MYLVEELKSEFFNDINNFVEYQRENGMPSSTVIHRMDEVGWIEKTGEWEPGVMRYTDPIPPKNDNTTRDCEIRWFPTNSDDEKVTNFYEHFKKIVLWANEEPTGWFFDLDILEDIQYTEYKPGQHYDWHIDTNPEDLQKARKISFIVLLGDEFEGGDLQIETRIPKSKVVEDIHKDAPRYVTVPLKPGSIVFFHSDLPHRVTPVTSGLRRTLVGWAAGPHFK